MKAISPWRMTPKFRSTKNKNKISGIAFAPIRFLTPFPHCAVPPRVITPFSNAFSLQRTKEDNVIWLIDYWPYNDVFDAEGRYIAKFCHPRREMIFTAKKNKIYCMVQESEEGIPLVKRYSMVWK